MVKEDVRLRPQVVRQHLERGVRSSIRNPAPNPNLSSRPSHSDCGIFSVVGRHPAEQVVRRRRAAVPKPNLDRDVDLDIIRTLALDSIEDVPSKPEHQKHLVAVKEAQLVGLGKEGTKLAARLKLGNNAGGTPSGFVDWKRRLLAMGRADARRLGLPWRFVTRSKAKVKAGSLPTNGAAVRRLKRTLHALG